MKNSVRHLVLVLAGIACVFALVSCAPRVAEKPKVEEQKVKESGPRCTRDVVRILPGPTQCLQSLSFVDGEYVLETEVLDRKSGEDESLLYKLNLKDLTLSPYQNSILVKNQKLEYLMDFDKKAVFLVSSKGHFSIVFKNSGNTINIPVPFESNESIYRSRIFLDQNRLFVYTDGRLLQWVIEKGKAQSRPVIKTSFGYEPGGCCMPWIDKIEGDKLHLINDGGEELLFDLKRKKTIVVKQGDHSNMHDRNYLRDKIGRTWHWDVSHKNSGNTLDTAIFELTCSEKGSVVAKYEIAGIQNPFFDKKGNLMIWTKSGTILKLIGDKWVQLIASPEFAQKTLGWANAIALEDGRICLFWRFDANPRDIKVDDPILKIIDIDKKEFEVMRFPFQLK
ncbi:MAG: hypothetical protein IPG59_05830 [Candidatus Melainabacteria bacterium]|nr:MAG: hypothetical protein IPG59_05830 [Candidatus Melainabacteria bacterium]